MICGEEPRWGALRAGQQCARSGSHVERSSDSWIHLSHNQRAEAPTGSTHLVDASPLSHKPAAPRLSPTFDDNASSNVKMLWLMVRTCGHYCMMR